MAAKANHEKRLARGRAVRSRRATLMRDVRHRRIDIESVLCDVPDALATCRIYDLLVNTPKIGSKRAQKICETLELWPLTHLEDISAEDRAAVYDAILSW